MRPVSGDASFRRYFRIRTADRTFIAMDAPPEREKLGHFLHTAELMTTAGINIPRIFAADEALGFLLMSDFGDISYQQQLTSGNADALYGDALDALLRIQRGIDPSHSGLPAYNEALLLRELGLFREWFLTGLLGLDLGDDENALYLRVAALLTASALQQPTVVVHRDFHSRNLMVTAPDNPGVLDFQDAVAGPITYDLVSLLRDCYIAWPETRVRGWVESYRERLTDSGLLDSAHSASFQRWFDLMGLQRHLKAVGIFSRLHLRDGKDRYLADIPRTLRYIREVSGKYPELGEFHRFLEGHVHETAERALVA